MTFTIIAPNANQSPGLFPAQNNTNFRRLKDIINADHNFTDSTATNQGAHKKVSLINVDPDNPPSGLPGYNGIFYSRANPDNSAQLWWYNGVSRKQLTPYEELLPIRFVFTNVLLKQTGVIVYPDPGFRYVGTATCIVDNTITYSIYSITRSGANLLFRTGVSDSANAPQFTFVGNDLRINNITPAVGGVTQTIVTSLIINRIS